MCIRDRGTIAPSSKLVYAFAVVPRENFSPSGTTNDYFYPNFINRSAWSYGDVGIDYCTAIGHSSSTCSNSPTEVYDWQYQLFASSSDLASDRFDDSYQHTPEGMSLWWQVLNPDGLGVGLWAQINFKDGYNGASGSTTSCLLYTSPSPRDQRGSRMPSSA